MNLFKKNAEIETTNQIADQPPRKTARLAGLFYLIFILTTVLATYIRGNIIVSGDAMVTANNIVSSQGLFRVGTKSRKASGTGNPRLPFPPIGQLRIPLLASVEVYRSAPIMFSANQRA